jgi:hypothetical protein
MTVLIKSYESGRHHIEMVTETRDGDPVYITRLTWTDDGVHLYPIKESTTGNRKNAMATYRRYIKDLTR